MSTLPQLRAHRIAAGAAYRAALDAFRLAWIELAAYDQAIVGVGAEASVPCFGPKPNPISMLHAEFAPDLDRDWTDDVLARFKQITRAYPTPDAPPKPKKRARRSAR